MGKVIAIANQKGGVTKTTTTVNLGAGLSKKGKKVLMIDADAQGSLTASLGFGEPDEIETVLPTILSHITQDEDFDKETGILKHEEGMDVMPCNIDLSVFEVNMINMMSREYLLKKYIDKVRDDYDYILIDCMPSLGIMTINALAAADSVIIPVQATYLPIKGLEQLIKTIGQVKRQLNPSLGIDGILINMVDERVKFSKEIIELLNNTYGQVVKIFNTKIPTSIRAAECTAEGVSIFSHDPKGKVAKAYGELIEEVLENE